MTTFAGSESGGKVIRRGLCDNAPLDGPDAPNAIGQPSPACTSLMTPAQCAQWIGGVTEAWVLRQARNGGLPAVRLGTQWRFHAQTILEKKMRNNK